MDLVGLIAVIGAFSVPLYALKVRYEERRRRLELEAARTGGGESGEEVKKLEKDNKLLRERVENLETIVCSVDFELNQKLAKMIDDQRSLVQLPAPATPAAPSAAGPTAPGKPDPLDRTATSHGTPSPNQRPLTTTLEPGQVLAQ